LYATRAFPPVVLGAYALFFTAFVLSAVVPTQLLFTPAELRALEAEGLRRLRLLDQSLLLGVLPSLIPAVLLELIALAGTRQVPARTLLPLLVTSALASFISPIQDHVRRLHHMAGVSWRAASMSVVQVVATVAVLLALPLAGVAAVWVPFGALVVANTLSLVAGLVLARERRAHPRLKRMRLRELLRSGRWILLGGLGPQGAVFVSGLLITRLAGAAAMGYVEAARLVGAPLQVLATGLGATTAPALMEAGRSRYARTGRRVTRHYGAMMLALGTAYVLMVGPDWPGNPLTFLIPTAYAVPWLAALSAVAALAFGLTAPPRYELLGGGQERHLMVLEAGASVSQVVVSFGAALMGPYTGPVGTLAQSAARWRLLTPARGRLYTRRFQRVPP
jgi:O-antigen/teichoic acid export membrane protein